MAAPTESFSHFHQEKNHWKGEKWCILAWTFRDNCTLSTLASKWAEAQSVKMLRLVKHWVWLTDSTWRYRRKSCQLGSHFTAPTLLALCTVLYFAIFYIKTGCCKNSIKIACCHFVLSDIYVYHCWPMHSFILIMSEPLWPNIDDRESNNLMRMPKNHSNVHLHIKVRCIVVTDFPGPETTSLWRLYLILSYTV